MDRVLLEQQLREVEILLHRGEQDLARQREAIGLLEQRGRDASAEKRHLRRMETRQARHVVDRNRMFRQLADCS